MRLKRVVCLVFLVSMFPLVLYAPVPALSEASQAVTEQEAREFLDEYIARYKKMDVGAFMALFSKEATENRSLPYADIYENYRKNFFNSISLSYDLQVYFMQLYPRSAFVSGRYELIQSLKPKGRQNIFRGNIQWNLVREGESLKILEIEYGRDRTR